MKIKFFRTATIILTSIGIWAGSNSATYSLEDDVELNAPTGRGARRLRTDEETAPLRPTTQSNAVRERCQEGALACAGVTLVCGVFCIMIVAALKCAIEGTCEPSWG